MYLNLQKLREHVYTKRHKKGYFCRCGCRTESFAAMVGHVSGCHSK